MAPFQQLLAARLTERRDTNLFRLRRTLASAQQAAVLVDGRRLLSFCSNDYLGLANHLAVVDAMREGASLYGCGSGASHLVCGHSEAHAELEAALARFTGRSRALVFSSGYMANVGVLTALLGKQDRVYEDRLSHASLLDGGLFSGARFRRYRHADVDHLKQMLEQDGDAEGLACVVSDGVFSMDGDVAPLAELMDVAERRDAVLMIDDAHGFGCLGAHGGGLAALLLEQGVDTSEQRLPILIGTLGKAFGTAGAFVAGSNDLIEALIQFSRPYIYTTALPPAVAHATLTSLALLQDEGWRRERLQTLIAQFRAGCAALGLTLTSSQTPIQGLLLGTPEAALAASRYLEQRSILVTAIRPPTVPAGTARLRITFSAAHDEDDVATLLRALAEMPRLA